MVIANTDFIPDVPIGGPLHEYRKQTKFNWKHLKIILDDPYLLETKYGVWNKLEKDPLFSRTTESLAAGNLKQKVAQQFARSGFYNFIPEHIYNASYRTKMYHSFGVNQAIHAFDPSLSIKLAASTGLFTNAILSMGTESHSEIYKAASTREIITSVAMTEVSHGSDTKRFRTTATYDPNTQEFIIHTPDFEAAKTWVANLGKSAHIALVFALLYMADGTCHGLQAFLVPIRDPKTHLPYPGVLVGDIGEKIGLNGIDNGFVMFDHYRIPRANHLNRLANVTREGIFETKFMEPSKALGAVLEGLSAGRIGIMQEGANNSLANAAVIAVRYAAIRKQFGTKDGEELPIIDYQLHQWRILPYLAAACVLKVSVDSLTKLYLDFVEKSQNDSVDRVVEKAAEIHAIISASKPLVTWTARDAIQEAREACGGHGYLKASNLGELRNNNDASVTYEGDNNVLGQQATHWLLRQCADPIGIPEKSALFLIKRETILTGKFSGATAVNPSFVLECYEWLLCWLLRSTAEKVEAEIENGSSSFTARNNAQVYRARDLSKAFAEFYAMKQFLARIQKPDVTAQLSGPLHSMFMIYGLWCLDKHLLTFYQGGYCSGPAFAEVIRGSLLEACQTIKDDAVAIADALAPPDFVLNSVIGKSDGNVYKNLQTAFFTNSGAMELAPWWHDILPSKINSKL